MVGVIIGSKRMGINPDNVATPMAASFGDLITLALLAGFSQWFYSFIGKQGWEQDVLVGLFDSVTHTVTETVIHSSQSQKSCHFHFWPTDGTHDPWSNASIKRRDPTRFQSEPWFKMKEWIMTFPLDRTVSLCVVPGGSVIVVPDPSLGGYRLQTPG